MITKLVAFFDKNKEKVTYLVLLSLIYTFLFPHYSWAYFSSQEIALVGNYSPVFSSTAEISLIEDEPLIILQGHTLVQTNNPFTPITPATQKQGPACPAPRGRLVTITAYSSSYDETDANPFITASGSHVRDGIIAANFLRFGTKVQIPALYGDKVFVVEDRMAPRNSHKVDIWMPSKGEAIQFGVKRAEIVVLEN